MRLILAFLALWGLGLSACQHLPSVRENGARGEAAQSQDEGGLLEAHGQLVLVLTESLESSDGRLWRFEKKGEGWAPMAEPFSVKLGKKGSAWGLGLHPVEKGMVPQKAEGDGKSPLGIFSIGKAFGYAAFEGTGLSYQLMGENDWCIDVPESAYYNEIIDKSLVRAPFLDRSSEPMRRDIHEGGDGRYALGFVIQHNLHGEVARGGSCIFAHLWKDERTATAGCTAMGEEDMTRLLAWLDEEKAPVFVLLTRKDYLEREGPWGLPKLSLD